MTFSFLGPWFRNLQLRRSDPDLDVPESVGARRRGPDQRRTGRVIAALQGTLVDLLAVLIPVDCVCCEKEDAVLCGSCAKRVRQLCRQPFRAELESPALVDVDGTAKIGVVAAGPYRDELARCLLSFKRHGQWRLADVLAPCLSKAVDTAIGGGSGYCLVPVPSSGRAYRRRGFSPVHLLLFFIRVRRMLPLCPILDVLKKSVTSGPLVTGPDAVREMAARLVAEVFGGAPVDHGRGGQKGLGRGERARRVRGSMSVRRGRTEDLKGRRCILVDDVLTTGATLAEAARAVTAAGGQVCGAVVLAATRPPAYASVAATGDPGSVIKTQSKNKWLKDE
ncbi:ComF family protein [Paenarthrobacter sp. NPDC091711]|uniref:ComF family protein n=1 Tax=Paenarthrobacter sp. NPDC091711 TaxID=3364385 RepID=UPI0037FF47DD